ncbi:MAG: hypothetical protein J5554_05110, partial [Paludibacteraceae bacterium]|nr:hypothetical protein [Paludibacteraceae bacterium]
KWDSKYRGQYIKENRLSEDSSMYGCMKVIPDGYHTLWCFSEKPEALSIPPILFPFLFSTKRNTKVKHGLR